MSNWRDFNGSVEYTDFTALLPAGDTYKPLPYVKELYAGVEWIRGVLDMAEAMKENRPRRVTAAQAAHIVDIASGFLPPMLWSGPDSSKSLKERNYA